VSRLAFGRAFWTVKRSAAPCPHLYFILIQVDDLEQKKADHFLSRGPRATTSPVVDVCDLVGRDFALFLRSQKRTGEPDRELGNQKVPTKPSVKGLLGTNRFEYEGGLRRA